MIFIEIVSSLTLMWSYTKLYDFPSVLIYVWWLLVNQLNTDYVHPTNDDPSPDCPPSPLVQGEGYVHAIIVTPGKCPV